MEFDSGTKFVKCSYCGSQIYIDRSGAGFYYALPFFHDQNAAIGIFRRWASGSTRAKDLDSLSRITSVTKKYFPVYMFKRAIDGSEKVLIKPARSTTLPGLHSLKVPAGDLKIFDDKFDAGDAELITPDIEMQSYTNSITGTPVEQALVYFPIWDIDYSFGGKNYEILIDGSSGEVFSGEFPGRSSVAYIAVAAIGFTAFVAEGILAIQETPLALALMGATVIGVFLSAFFVAKRL